MSVPQMPTRWTRTSASPGPGAGGSGNSTGRNVLGDWSWRAYIINADEQRRRGTEGVFLDFDLCSKHSEELPDPSRMSGPCGSGDEGAVGIGVVERAAGGDILAAGQLDFGLAGRIGTETAALHHNAGSRQELSTMTDSGDRFFGSGKVLDHFDDARIHAQVLGRSTAGDD